MMDGGNLKLINRELYTSYLRGRITTNALRIISGCRSTGEFKSELFIAKSKWGIKTGNNPEVRLFREMS